MEGNEKNFLNGFTYLKCTQLLAYTSSRSIQTCIPNVLNKTRTWIFHRYKDNKWLAKEIENMKMKSILTISTPIDATSVHAYKWWKPNCHKLFLEELLATTTTRTRTTMTALLENGERVLDEQT
ncbi:hypothetical protein Scep_010033 [Stephania cephalantha]|uniref:Uncharacterized protein n=1 Tax=Stephania cephalantha TaxID=152367 RepID=A0AAP0JUB9_9MAGN